MGSPIIASSRVGFIEGRSECQGIYLRVSEIGPLLGL